MKQNMISDLLLIKLRKSIEKIVKIPDEEWNYACQFFKIEHFPKGSHLFEMGEVAKKNYTITKGIVRLYFTDSLGRDLNKYFGLEYATIGSLSSNLLKSPSTYSAEALEDTEVISMENHVLEKLYERHVCWERLSRISAELILIEKELRERELALDSLEMRYRKFIEKYPQVHQRIPLYHVASYLGVTDVALSRIRKKMNLT